MLSDTHEVRVLTAAGEGAATRRYRVVNYNGRVVLPRICLLQEDSWANKITKHRDNLQRENKRIIQNGKNDGEELDHAEYSCLTVNMRLMILRHCISIRSVSSPAFCGIHQRCLPEHKNQLLRPNLLRFSLFLFCLRRRHVLPLWVSLSTFCSAWWALGH